MATLSKRRIEGYFVIFRILLALTLIPGIYYLRIGGSMLKYDSQLYRFGVRVDAKVLGLGVYQVDSPGRTGKVEQHSYLFEFIDKNGNKIEVNSTQGYNSHFEPYNDDGTMPIIYNPTNPKQNRVNSFGAMWLTPIFQLFLGLFITFFGLMAVIPVSVVKRIKGIK